MYIFVIRLVPRTLLILFSLYVFAMGWRDSKGISLLALGFALLILADTARWVFGWGRAYIRGPQ